VIDDQALVINVRGRGLVIVTGCGHAGVVNIIRQAMRLTGVSGLLAVIGGFHLSGPAFEPIEPTVGRSHRTRARADRAWPLHRMACAAHPGRRPPGCLGAVQRRNHLHPQRRLAA
jgi:metal-dependent hydrolase (beta-lactamase superfamily II)